MAQASEHDFDRVARLLRARAGIVLGEHKREMADRVLGLRAKCLGKNFVDEYLDLLEMHDDSPEWDCFVNAFTINHTAFFREAHHFDTLAKWARGRKQPLSVWCCAASTGEEAYSIAMTLQDAWPQGGPKVSIWASDIDTQAIERAEQGVYSLEQAKAIPEAQLKKYFYRGTGSQTGMVRVKPALRDMVQFGVFNLMSRAWPTSMKLDVIFCRNVMIYFDKEFQAQILERMATVLMPGGLLCVGHSENFTYLTNAFRLQGQTVYVRVRGDNHS
ncbi:MAG: CheR family methyltransferase [Paralcaligenes sp.]